MTPEQKQVWDMHENGMSLNAISREIGKARSTVQSLYRRAKKYVELDDGVRSAMSECGLQNAPHSGWLKTENASLYFQTPKDDQNGEFQAWVELAKEALSDIPRATPSPLVTMPDHTLMTRYLLADLHFGMRAWAAEAGDDYDMSIAVDRLHTSFTRLLESSPNSENAYICNLGDTYHGNDSKNMTPGSGHILDVDGRFAKIAMESVRAIAWLIDQAKQKHQHVTFVGVQGNHDPDQGHWLSLALMMRYENDPRVTVVYEPAKLHAFEFGRNLIAMHHGDKAPADRLVHQLADTYSEMWGRTNWRYLDTGHIHSDSAKDIGGVHWQSHRTLASKDAYAAGSAYVSRQTLKSITVHEEFGEVVRNTVGVV